MTQFWQLHPNMFREIRDALARRHGSCRDRIADQHERTGLRLRQQLEWPGV